MEVIGLIAEPNPAGNRIDLVWVNPTDAGFRGVKILRREATYPEFPGDLGSEFQIHDEPSSTTPAGATGRFSDLGLKSETVYYYAVAAYDNSLSVRHFPVFVSEMATGAYLSAGTMYRNLPALYQRFDLLKPPSAPDLDTADKDKGQLLRLFEMIGPQLDLMRSFAKAATTFSNVNRIDGALLPLLASTIGWETANTLSLAKQRNEINYAPHFYRTTGIAANLQATLNRVTPWKAEIKEFVHNVFMSNEPEQLPIWEIDRVGAPASAPQLLTLDMAYEGRPSSLLAADGRQWIFYHAQQSVPSSDGTEERWQLFYKVHGEDDWLPSRQLTLEGNINKYPTALQRQDGSFWLFWTAFEKRAERLQPQIKLAIFSAGRDARRPRITATLPGPFAFVDGEVFRITIISDGISIPRTVTLHEEHFRNLAVATPSELAALLNREVPNANATVNKDGRLVIEASVSGATSFLTVPASAIATKIGLAAGTTAGANGTSAQIQTSRIGPFALADGLTLSVRVDSRLPVSVVFRTLGFVDITQATAAEVTAAINRVLPNVAQAVAGRIQLASSTIGESSFIEVLVNESTAAAALGFGAPLPAPTSQPDDSEPSAFQDAANNVWLFWSSRRSGLWNIWFNRFSGTAWGDARPLTTGTEGDREPFAVFDPVGRIWVFWSRKKANGLWNIFHRTTTALAFPPVGDPFTPERELTPAPVDFENKEPALVVTAPNAVELFYASSVTHGWHIRSVAITPLSQGVDQAITSGQFSHRAPVAVRTGSVTRLSFRSNESLRYISRLYPSARTLDARYGGSTTTDSDNALKIGDRGKLTDILRYTYDGEKGETNWYARDVLGIFLSADTNDKQIIERTSLIIESVVKRFLPIQVRVVLVVSSPAGFLFLRTWKAGMSPGLMPDLNVPSPDLSFRLFLAGVTEGV